MKRDGTPETALEEWVLEMGLGHYYTVTAQDDLTKAQAERLAESTLNPERNAKHAQLFDLLMYGGDPNSANEVKGPHR